MPMQTFSPCKTTELRMMLLFLFQLGNEFVMKRRYIFEKSIVHNGYALHNFTQELGLVVDDRENYFSKHCTPFSFPPNSQCHYVPFSTPSHFVHSNNSTTSVFTHSFIFHIGSFRSTVTHRSLVISFRIHFLLII